MPDQLFFDGDALTFGAEYLYFGDEVGERGITTFADLIDEPNANKVILAELYLAEKLIGFTRAGALNTYQKDYLNEIIELNDGGNTLVRKEIEELKANGTALTERSSVADVESNAGSFFHDPNKNSYNGVSNGGFTSSTDGWGVLITGTLTSESGGQSGNCLQIESTDSGTNGAAQILRVIPGDTVQLTVYAKAGTEATYRVRVLEYAGGTYLYDSGSLEETAGDWSTQVDSGVLTIPSNCTRIRVEIFMTATGASDTFFFDTVVCTVYPAKPRIYVHTSGSNDPSLYTMIGYFWLRLATEGIILNGYYYEPYISERGMPSLKLENPDIYWGVTQVSGGSLKLINNSGFFDQISRRWLWSNKQIRVLLGGEQLPYSEYKLLRTHLITDKKWTRESFDLTLKPKMHDFFRKVPTGRFTVDVYSSMDPDLEGEIIPIVYGLCHSREAVPAYCMAMSHGSDLWEMKCAGHQISSFMAAYIKYNDETGWESVPFHSSSLLTASFKFQSGSYAAGRHDVKVAIAGVVSGGSYLEKPPQVLEHFLTTYCDVATSDISSSHLSTSLGRTEATLALPIIEEMEALDVIDAICKSDLAFFDEDEEGKFRYRTWTAIAATSFATIDEKHVLKYDVSDDVEKIFKEVRVGYRYNPMEEEWLYVTKVYTPGGYLYDQQLTLTHDTYINDKSSAERLAERLLLHTRQPPVELNCDVKMAIVDRLLGDQMKLTLARSPFETAGGWDDRVFELSRIDLSFFPIKTKARAFDLGLFGGNVGYWVASDISSYGAYAPDNLTDKGFWSDSAGYVVTGSETTLNISNWW